MEIRKIRKDGDKKVVSIPAKSDMQIGDYVIITPFKDIQNHQIKGVSQTA